MSVSPGLVRAQAILFASLAVTLFVAFIAVLGKQWIMYYKRASSWGSVVDRGKERQVKFAGLQKWGLLFLMGSLPVLLQLALLLFAIGLVFYLWDIDLSAAEVILAVTCFGSAFYAGIAVVATVWSDCPFKTPLSIFLPKVLPWTKEITAHVRIRLRRWATAFLHRTERAEEHAHPMAPIVRLPNTSFGSGDQAAGIIHYDYMTFSNPAFWRKNPLFAPPLTMDTTASAAFWLLENSTDFSTAAAVAAGFCGFQWPSRHNSTTALIRLRDAYTQCFRAPVFDIPARLKALQSAAAYFVLYRTRLIWSTSKSSVEKLPLDLPHDLLQKDNEEWEGCDLFEYLLRVQDRSAPVTSARFLSYIAPYWFCGDSDSAIRSRSMRLESVGDLIAVLESSKELAPATLTDCVLCVGAAMDFPLHPEDLIRVDKRSVFLLDVLSVVLIGDSYYLSHTFQLVVEHIQNTALTGGYRYRHVAEALMILSTLVRRSSLESPLVDAAWITELLIHAAMGDVADDEFTQLLAFRAWGRNKGDTVDPWVGNSLIRDLGTNPQSFGTTATSEALTSDDILFRKVMKIIQTRGRQEEVFYGGLLAIRYIRCLGPSLFDDDALQTFHEALDYSNPLRIRQAAYDAMLVTQGRWLKSEHFRQKLEDLDLFSQLHSVVVEIARHDYQRSFLAIMEVSSEDVNWHPYLREHMELWVPLRYEGEPQILHIIGNVGGITVTTPGDRGSTSLDDFLQSLMVEEWAAVPRRLVGDLTADRLEPLADVTRGFKELLFDDSCRRAVLARVEKVLPGLDLRREDSYAGPGDDVRDIINELLKELRVPRRQFSLD